MFVGPAGWLKAFQAKALRRLLIYWAIGIFVILAWFKGWPQMYTTDETRETPLLDDLFRLGHGIGGRWYIPSSWTDDAPPILNTPAEAAQHALELCVRGGRYLHNSKIPMIIHQTWKTSHLETWPEADRQGAEAWLEMALGNTERGQPPMAYIFWDDAAMNAMVSRYEKDLWVGFKTIPHGVEKADIFRVLLMKWFGGIYADVDAEPLQHPVAWVHDLDLTDWQDENHTVFSVHAPAKKSYRAPASAPAWPTGDEKNGANVATKTAYRDVLALADADADAGAVAAIVGIEADTPPDSDDSWRMGYDYPVQITNWAMAMAPQHPAAARYVEQVNAFIKANQTRLERVDPLEFTGPPAFTRAFKEYSELDDRRFTWESVSGLKDPVGGRGKVVAGDILVLPITGFSPGRGKFHNMGSQPVDHPNARLSHIAQGSWRKTSLEVEAGKLCRTLFGMCRNWSKVP